MEFIGPTKLMSKEVELENGLFYKPQNGLLNLTGYDFKKNGNLVLKGEWLFFWESLIKPNEINSSKLRIILKL